MNGYNIKEIGEKLNGAGSVDLGQLFFISAVSAVKTAMYFSDRGWTQKDIMTSMKGIANELSDIYKEAGIQEKAELSDRQLTETVSEICTKAILAAMLPIKVREAMFKEAAEDNVSEDIEEMLKEITERTENNG